MHPDQARAPPGAVVITSMVRPRTGTGPCGPGAASYLTLTSSTETVVGVGLERGANIGVPRVFHQCLHRGHGSSSGKRELIAEWIGMTGSMAGGLCPAAKPVSFNDRYLAGAREGKGSGLRDIRRAIPLYWRQLPGQVASGLPDRSRIQGNVTHIHK